MFFFVLFFCTMPVPDPPPPTEEAVSVLKKIFFAHYMYGNGLVEVWVFWNGSGWFGVVLSVSMDRTTVMLTDEIRKRVCLAL